MSLTDQELELAELLHEADEAYVAELMGCDPGMPRGRLCASRRLGRS